MDSSKSKRVVLYCRVATQAQLDGDHALEAQSARLHEQAERLGYEIVGEVSEYEKGTTLDRDGWKRACQEAVEQKADILLVAELTRIAREPILWMQALRELSGIKHSHQSDRHHCGGFHLLLCGAAAHQSALCSIL